MFRSLAAAFVLASSAASAISFSNPRPGSVWGYSELETISWSAQATDPSVVSFMLVNTQNTKMLEHYPVPLALNVPTSQGSFSLKGVSIPAMTGWVVLAVNPNNSSDIYAQGGTFSVAQSNAKDSNGAGFSIASYTTINAGQPAGGKPTGAARMVKHKRN